MPALELSLPTMTQESNVADSDLSLLQRYFVQKDQAAMERLFVRHAGTAYRIALREVGNAADAEEAVQTAFLNVLTKGDRNVTHVRGWIMGIVVNACRDRIKGDARRRERQESGAPDRSLDQPASAEQAELLSASLRMVKALPEHYRLPVSLHFLEGLSFREIASALTLPEDTVRKQANRGIEQIRQSLAAAGFTAGIAALPELLATPATSPVPATLTASFKTMIASVAAATSAAASGAAAAKGGAVATGSSNVVAYIAYPVLILAAAAAAIHFSPASKPIASNVTRTGSAVPAASTPVPFATPVVSFDEKLQRHITCSYNDTRVSKVLASLSDRLGVHIKLSPDAEAQAADKVLTFDMGEVSGREALDGFAAEAKLKVQIRNEEVVLEPLHAAADPAPIDLAPGIGNLLQIVDIKLESLDAPAAAKKLSTTYNVNIYFSDAALVALKDQKIDLDLKQLNGIEVLGRLCEKTKLELRVLDGAVVLSLPGEPQLPEPKAKPVGKHEDF